MDIRKMNLVLHHPGVIKLAKELEKMCYIESVRSPEDAERDCCVFPKRDKRRCLNLKSSGKKLQVNKAIFGKQQHHLLKAIGRNRNRYSRRNHCIKGFKKIHP
jgi:hypothetical protein